MKPQGRLLMTIHDERGEIVATRAATNRVLRGGAGMIANLFSGAPQTGIDGVRLGFGHVSVDPTADRLTPPAEAIPADRLKAPLTKDDFTVRISDDRVTVDVSAPFKAQQKLTDVSEAGLIAGDTLYNQVVFEPITIQENQTVTFFWQIDFPFGQ
jgi:hypothetical protein